MQPPLSFIKIEFTLHVQKLTSYIHPTKNYKQDSKFHTYFSYLGCAQSNHEKPNANAIQFHRNGIQKSISKIDLRLYPDNQKQRDISITIPDACLDICVVLQCTDSRRHIMHLEQCLNNKGGINHTTKSDCRNINTYTVSPLQ